MNPGTVMLMLKLIDGIILLVNAAPKIKSDMQAMSLKIQSMVAEKRDPTEEEWAEIDALTEALHQRIQEAHGG